MAYSVHLVPSISRAVKGRKVGRTENEHGEYRLLEEGRNLVEDRAEEWVLSVNRYLGVKDPNAAYQLG